MIAIPIVLIVLFIVWNNIPELVEAVGYFLVAHAKAIKQRPVLYKELRDEVKPSTGEDTYGKDILVPVRNS